MFTTAPDSIRGEGTATMTTQHVPSADLDAARAAAHAALDAAAVAGLSPTPPPDGDGATIEGLDAYTAQWVARLAEPRRPSEPPVEPKPVAPVAANEIGGEFEPPLSTPPPPVVEAPANDVAAPVATRVIVVNPSDADIDEALAKLDLNAAPVAPVAPVAVAPVAMRPVTPTLTPAPAPAPAPKADAPETDDEEEEGRDDEPEAPEAPPAPVAGAVTAPHGSAIPAAVIPAAAIAADDEELVRRARRHVVPPPAAPAPKADAPEAPPAPRKRDLPPRRPVVPAAQTFAPVTPPSVVDDGADDDVPQGRIDNSTNWLPWLLGVIGVLVLLGVLLFAGRALWNHFHQTTPPSPRQPITNPQTPPRPAPPPISGSAIPMMPETCEQNRAACDHMSPAGQHCMSAQSVLNTDDSDVLTSWKAPSTGMPAGAWYVYDTRRHAYVTHGACPACDARVSNPDGSMDVTHQLWCQTGN